MVTLLLHLLRLLPMLRGGHRQVALENLALRQQLAVYKKMVTRPKLLSSDRLFWVALSRVWAGWRQALVIVSPNTVLRWQRRRFLLTSLAGALAAPLAVEAQPAGKMYRIGLLSWGPRMSAADAFVDEMRVLGYAEGRNLTMEYRWWWHLISYHWRHRHSLNRRWMRLLWFRRPPLWPRRTQRRPFP